MTGHIFVFNQGIVKLREYIASGEMARSIMRIPSALTWGRLDMMLMPLGLSAHDISIFNFLFNSAPVSVSARGINVWRKPGGSGFCDYRLS